MGADRKVVEMDADHKPVWTYGPEEGLQHPISAQRLPNGNTLIGDAQLGKVIEIGRDRAVVWKYESPDLANMRMRNSRRTDGGTTLISVEAAGKVVRSIAGETRDIRPIWASGFDTLPDGGLLVSDYQGRRILEIGKDGKVLHDVRMPTRNTATSRWRRETAACVTQATISIRSTCTATVSN